MLWNLHKWWMFASVSRCAPALPRDEWQVTTSHQLACYVCRYFSFSFFFFPLSLFASPTLSRFIRVYTRRHFLSGLSSISGANAMKWWRKSACMKWQIRADGGRPQAHMFILLWYHFFKCKKKNDGKKVCFFSCLPVQLICCLSSTVKYTGMFLYSRKYMP